MFNLLNITFITTDVHGYMLYLRHVLSKKHICDSFPSIVSHINVWRPERNNLLLLRGNVQWNTLSNIFKKQVFFVHKVFVIPLASMAINFEDKCIQELCHVHCLYTVPWKQTIITMTILTSYSVIF